MYLTGDTAEAGAPAGPASGPSAGLYLTEPARGLAGLAFLPLAAPWLAMAPRGDGHGVLVVPGFLATDTSTALLRRFMRRLRHGSLTTMAEVERLFLPPHRPDHPDRISSSGQRSGPSHG